MNATIEKNLVAIARTSQANGYNWLVIDIPNGWDDVKKICKKVLSYNGKKYTFTGWNSDRNECFFRDGAQFAKVS